jgi:hypothetical protein
MNPGKEQIGEKEFSKLFTNKVDGIMDFAKTHPTQTTEAAAGTVWGAYNAISGYFGYQKNYKSQEEKMNDLYFKGATKKIESAFALATTMI